MNPSNAQSKNLTELLDDFRKFCKVDRNLSDRSIDDYVWVIRSFAKWLNRNLTTTTRDDLRNYIIQKYANAKPNTKGNLLRAFRCFYKRYLGSPITDTFRYPAIPFTPKQVFSTEQLRRFYESLTTPLHRLLFLLLATSGLREGEILELRYGDIQIMNRAIVPSNHEGSTKKSWCSFYSPECDQLLNDHLATKTWKQSDSLFSIIQQDLRKTFDAASKQSGFKIRPKDLRDWFAQEMGNKGIQDRYVDALQGRTPKSILARHYTDFTIDKMKVVYESANLRVLN